MAVYGIDLGSTYSCIAYVDEAFGQPIVVPNRRGDLTTPSVVLFEDGNTRVVGEEAKGVAVLHEDRVVDMVRQYMDQPEYRFVIKGQDHSPEEVASHIILELADHAEQYLGMRPKDAVLSCPPYFGIFGRHAIEEAGRKAGLNVLDIISEPIAAVISYELRNEPNQVVIVYDLGGATFDLSLIEINDGSLMVVATEGDHYLGGRDWDERLVEHLAREWILQTGADPGDDPRASLETLQDLWRRAEYAKRTLSVAPQVTVLVSHAGEAVRVVVTREQFEELTRPLLEQTIMLTGYLLEEGRKRGYGSVDQFLLVGGASKMPQVSKGLTDEFNVEPKIEEPDLAVAKGAATYARLLQEPDLPQKRGGRRRKKERKHSSWAQPLRVYMTMRSVRAAVCAAAGLFILVVVASWKTGVSSWLLATVVAAISATLTSWVVAALDKGKDLVLARPNPLPIIISVKEANPWGSGGAGWIFPKLQEELSTPIPGDEHFMGWARANDGIPASGNEITILVQGRGEQATILHRMGIEILDAKPLVDGTWVGLSRNVVEGVLEPRHFTVELDQHPPAIVHVPGSASDVYSAGFPYTVDLHDPEEFRLRPNAGRYLYTWRILVDWTCGESSGTTVIDNGGVPFQTGPSSSGSRWQWNLDNHSPGWSRLPQDTGL